MEGKLMTSGMLTPIQAVSAMEMLPVFSKIGYIKGVLEGIEALANMPPETRAALIKATAYCDEIYEHIRPK